MKRKTITFNCGTRLLTEVNGHCPLCGKHLLGEKASSSLKFYEIAHIYPHSPTDEQLVALKDVLMPDEVESFENLIALCKDCHKKQDFHTTADDYTRLYNLKQRAMRQYKAMDSASNIPIETQIEEVLQKLKQVDIDDIISLSYAPVVVERKISSKNSLLREKVKDFVVRYFPFIQDMFKELEGARKLKYDKIAYEVKLCFLTMEEHGLSQEDTFQGLVGWLQSKTQSQYGTACEVVVAFFIQNCEVFNEITE